MTPNIKHEDNAIIVNIILILIIDDHNPVVRVFIISGETSSLKLFIKLELCSHYFGGITPFSANIIATV